MATNMKTIKFGESGETYYVNERPVQVSGELTEDAMVIDFGSFDGLTELECVVWGAATEGNYLIFSINGTKLSFVNAGGVYNDHFYLRIKKVGDVWTADARSGTNGVSNVPQYIGRHLNGVDAITSFALNAYSGTPFVAGTKYALEGR